MSKIGIPQCLLFYRFFPFWKTFFSELGYEIVLSSQTNKSILELGVKHCVDDACLPVKLGFGHVLDLCENKNVDYLFLPRIISIEKRSYTCPKIMGFPDMIKCNINNLPTSLDITVDMRKPKYSLHSAFFELGKQLGKSSTQVKKAIKQATLAQQAFQSSALQKKNIIFHPHLNFYFEPQKEANKKKKIGVLGHPYLIYDKFVSFRIIDRLVNLGYSVVTPELIPEDQLEESVKDIPHHIFWHEGESILGTAYYLLDTLQVNGLILIISFECGEDALLRELLEHKTQKEGKVAYMSLVVDEHTGEAGVLTRLEAFLDTLNHGKKALFTIEEKQL